MPSPATSIQKGEEIVHHHKLLGTALVAGVAAFSLGHAHAGHFVASLSGFNEIGSVGAGETGAILSNGRGSLVLDLNRKAGTADYTLTYSGLGSSVTVAHIILGKSTWLAVSSFSCVAAVGRQPVRRVVER